MTSAAQTVRPFSDSQARVDSSANQTRSSLHPTTDGAFRSLDAFGARASHSPHLSGRISSKNKQEAVRDLNEQNLTERARAYLRELGWKELDFTSLESEREQFFETLLDQAYDYRSTSLVQALSPQVVVKFVSALEFRNAALDAISKELAARVVMDFVLDFTGLNKGDQNAAVAIDVMETELDATAQIDGDQNSKVFATIVPGRVSDAQWEFLTNRRWTEDDIFYIEMSKSVKGFVARILDIALDKADCNVLKALRMAPAANVEEAVDVRIQENSEIIGFLRESLLNKDIT